VRCPLRSPSYVEGLWSPSLAHVTENSQAKADAKHRCSFRPQCGGVFLPQAGPRFGLVLLQAGHHLVVVTRRPPPETTKATHWVALDWLGMRLAT
jgi:hypothetical protein